MIQGLLETGTPFKGIDFKKLKDKHEQFAKDLAADDDLDVQDDGDGGLRSGTQDAPQALNVGDTDIPVRDQRYIDQRQQRFDTAPGTPQMHIPTFEDED
jgi:hypothetical protein